ncbi:hypothetical protein RB195_022139 [Necator americanus]
MDNTDMEGSHGVHVVQKKNVKCVNCGGSHYRSTSPLLFSNTGQKLRQKLRRRSNRRKRSQCKNVVTFSAENARTDVNIRTRYLRFQLDTSITLVSRQRWKKLGSPPLKPCIMPVKTTDGSPMKIDGRFSTDFFFRDRITGKNIQGNGTCYVTESTNLLGLEWCIQLPAYKELKGKLEEAMRRSIQCELGRCVKTKAKLLLRDNAVPVFKKKRPVPYAFVTDLDAEIDRLFAEQVISPVEHSEWVTPIVVVKKKSGQIRLCGDFSTGLNDALQLHQHPLPTAEHVFTKLNGEQLFTHINFAEAYLQVEVEEESKGMLTIKTHRGLYRYNRLPFGVKSVPGIFQHIMDSMICGLEGVAAYQDDVIVKGRTQQIRYLGCSIYKDKRNPDPEKIEAIRQMPVPKNVAEMRHLHALLDALLKKDVPFKWNEECEAAFNRVKKVLASDLLLTHFDPSPYIIVAADASDHGIGTVFLHRMPDGTEKAIWHANRSLTAAETNYGQIEKEGLALIFAVRKFHRYIYGR